jgi:hypothetical protein
MLSFDEHERDHRLPEFREQLGILFMSMLEAKPGPGVAQKRAVSCTHYLSFRTGFRGRSAVGFSWPPYEVFYDCFNACGREAGHAPCFHSPKTCGSGTAGNAGLWPRKISGL